METAHLRLDTYRIIKRLEDRGFSEEQAEGILQTIEEIQIEGVATKGDLIALKAALRSDIATLETTLSQQIKDTRNETSELRHEMHSTIGQLRAELYKALFYQAFAVVGLTVTLLKFLG